MEILEAIKARASTRAFLDQPVSKSDLETLLDVSRWAPSGTNTQPWSVAVLAGSHKKNMCDALEQAYLAGEPSEPDYQYYPTEKLPEPYRSRRFNCGMALYGALNIERQDKQRRKEVWCLNYQAFNAPVMLLFFIDKFVEKGSWLDYGMFMQNVMLAAEGLGLATCPQAALAEYPNIVRQQLAGCYDDKVLVAGMALGYPDPEAPINNYRTERETVAGFTQWFLD